MANETRLMGSILASMLFRHVEWRYTYFQPITPPIDEQWLSGPRSRPPITATPPPRTLATHEKDAIEAALMESKGGGSRTVRGGIAARPPFRDAGIEN